jgi:hypothetical protein
MPSVYGTNTAFQSARDALETELNELAADMVTNVVVPRFDAVYDTWYETPAPDYNCVCIGIPRVDGREIVGAGREEFIYRFTLRVLTGDFDDNFEEERFLNLANSIMNWMFTHEQTMANNYRLKREEPIEIVANVRFDDIQAIGGTVSFSIYGVEAYTAL